MIVISVFEAKGDRDTMEGKMGLYHIGYFKNRYSAEQAARGKGVWGRDGDVFEKTLVIYDEYEEWASDHSH